MAARIKRALSSVLAVAMLFSLVPTALAAGAETDSVDLGHNFYDTDKKLVDNDMLSKLREYVTLESPFNPEVSADGTFEIPKPTTTTMADAVTSENTIPYLTTDNGETYQITSITYTWYTTKSSGLQTNLVSHPESISVGETWPTTPLTYHEGVEWGFILDLQTKYPNITYEWTLVDTSEVTGTCTVSYDLNIGGDRANTLPSSKNITIRYASDAAKEENSDIEAGMLITTESAITAEKLQQGLNAAKEEVNQGDNFDLKPGKNSANGLVKGYFDEDNKTYFAAVTDSKGTTTYYVFLGWSADGTTNPEEYWHYDARIQAANAPTMTIYARWEKIDLAATAKALKDEGAPEIVLATNNNSATVEQHNGDGNWTSDQVILGEDGTLYYRASLQMTNAVAALLGGQKVQNKEFAHFDIAVELDENLRLQGDKDGNVSFTFTCAFLKPSGKLLVGENQTEVNIPVASQAVSSTYAHTITAAVADLTDEEGHVLPFVIPVDWDVEHEDTNDGYTSSQLLSEITLEMVAAIADSEVKSVTTGGQIIGQINFEKVLGTSQFLKLVGYLEADDVLQNYYVGEGVDGLARTLLLAETVREASQRIVMPGNEVVAVREGTEPDPEPTGTLHISKYVADNEADPDAKYSFTAKIGDQTENFTLKNGETKTFTDLALDTAYSVVETDTNGYNATYYNEKGTITDENLDVVAAVINVPVDEGALVISKTVNGGSLTKEFTFKVELSAAGTYSYTGSKTGTITSGGTVTLKNGESISINNLPAGTTYTVTETAVDGYTTTISGDDATMNGAIESNAAFGTIVKGAAAVAHYTNTYKSPVVPPVPADEYDLTVTKKLSEVNGKSYKSGNVEVGDELTYTITVKNTGDYKLSDITMTDELPEDVELVDATKGYDYDERSGELSWTISSLAVGKSETFTVTAEVLDGAEGDSLRNTAVAENKKVYAKDSVTVKVSGDKSAPVTPSKPTLNLEDHEAYIIGYVDGTVRPLNDISRSEVATIFFRLLTDESRAYYWSQSNDYSDVDAGDWFNNAVSTLSNAGIITGYLDGTFRPDAPITRSEFAAIAARFSDVIYNGGNRFSDVPASHWAARYIALAEHLGWITGYPDGTFKPEQNITRAESMTLINRVLERAVEEEHMLPDMVTWVDNVPGTWYYEAVQEATNSHEYVRTFAKVPGQDFNYENWQEILTVPDWAALEKIWSTANSKS